MSSPALVKAQNALQETRSALSSVRAEKKEAPMKGAIKALSGNATGGAIVGAIRGATDTAQPVELLVIGAGLAGGWLTKSPFLVGVAGGAAACFAAEQAENRVRAFKLARQG